MKYCLGASNHLGFQVLSYLYSNQVDIVLVLTDSNSEEVIDFCIANSIRCFKGNPRNGRAIEFINNQHIKYDILLSVNYLFIIEQDLIDSPRHYAVNVHGSLLPRYRGRCPNVWSIINGEKEYGTTAHFMNSKCDDGDIIKQLVIPIGEETTGGELLEKENEFIPVWTLELTKELESGHFERRKQDVSKATYFGKRTPADGHINWDWQKERIQNWVRAQAMPYYPGAFAYIDRKKIIINRISFSDMGFSWDIPNGTVVECNCDEPFVKTPNGIVKLEEVVFDGKIEKGDILE